MSDIGVRALRLGAALVLGGLCALGALVMLDPALSFASGLDISSCTTVNNTNDSGLGSLRAAVACVAPGGTIGFSLPANSTILLTTGEIAVTQTNITINGTGAPGVKVDGNGASRVFLVSAPLSIISLTVQNGVTDSGGGLYSSSDVTLTNVSFFSNTASANGGGAYVFGNATVNGGRFQGNASSGQFGGGGMYVAGTLVLSGTQFLSNTATGGGGLFVFSGMTVNGGLFQNNSATGSTAAGGAIYANNTLALTGTQFISNSAPFAGGAYVGGNATLNGGLFQDNHAPINGFTAGGLDVAGAAVLTGTQFLSNTASIGGGGLYLHSASTLNGGLFLGNQCTGGGCLGGGWRADGTLGLSQFITIADNIQNNGLTTQSAGSVILFNGSQKQTIAGTGSTTFNDLWVANTGPGLYLGQDITVTGLLTLSSDLTTTRNYTLHLTANETGSGTGDVWGRSDRNHPFINGVTYSFGNPNVSVDFPGGPPTHMTVDLTHTVPAGSNFSNSLQRYYDIAQQGGSGFTATLRLHYQDSELGANSEASLQIWHYPAGGPWTALPIDARDTSANWLESNAVTGFSPWAVSQNGPAGPTAVGVESFGAHAAGATSAAGAFGMGAAGVLLGLAAAAGLRLRSRRAP